LILIYCNNILLLQTFSSCQELNVIMTGINPCTRIRGTRGEKLISEQQIDASCYLLVIFVHVGPSKHALNLFSFPLYSHTRYTRYTRREINFRAGFDDTNRRVVLFVSDFCSCSTIETCSEFIFFPCTVLLHEERNLQLSISFLPPFEGSCLGQPFQFLAGVFV